MKCVDCKHWLLKPEKSIEKFCDNQRAPIPRHFTVKDDFGCCYGEAAEGNDAEPRHLDSLVTHFLRRIEQLESEKLTGDRTYVSLVQRMQRMEHRLDNPGREGT